MTRTAISSRKSPQLCPISAIHDQSAAGLDVITDGEQTQRLYGPPAHDQRGKRTADRLSFSPDCDLSQTARWAAREKLKNRTIGIEIVRQELR